MCKPIVPLVQDKIAHFFWEAQHITEVHNHHGDQHTEHEMASSLHDESNKNSSASKTPEPVSIHLIAKSVQSTPQLRNATAKLDMRIYSAASLSLDEPFLPPRFL